MPITYFITKKQQAYQARRDMSSEDRRSKDTMLRLLGIAMDGVFSLLRAAVTLPARILGGGRA